MTIKEILLIFKKRLLLIIVTAIFISVAIGLTFSFLVKPTYQASEYLLIGDLQSENKESLYEESQKIPQIIASTVDFIQSPIVLGPVEEKLNLEPSTLRNQLSIANNANSQLISITVVDKNPLLAREAATVLAQTTIEKMKETMAFTQVSLLDKNTMASEKSNVLSNYALAVLLGLLSGLGAALIIEQFDGSVKSEKAAEELMGAPILGSITSKEKASKNTQGMTRKERREVNV